MPMQPGWWMKPGMMPILHSPGVMTPGQLGPIRRAPVRCQRGLDPQHVQHRDALGDADDQTRSRRRPPPGWRRRRRAAARRSCWRSAPVASTAWRTVLNTGRFRWVWPPRPGRDAADQLGAVGQALLGMECGLLAGEALAQDLGVAVDQDAHVYSQRRVQCQLKPWPPPFCAASSRSSAAMIDKPRIREQLPALRRVGALQAHHHRHLDCTSFTAAMMPSAIRSQRTMPPKMLTSTAFTAASERISLKASATFSGWRRRRRPGNWRARRRAA